MVFGRGRSHPPMTSYLQGRQSTNAMTESSLTWLSGSKHLLLMPQPWRPLCSVKAKGRNKRACHQGDHSLDQHRGQSRRASLTTLHHMGAKRGGNFQTHLIRQKLSTFPHPITKVTIDLVHEEWKNLVSCDSTISG